MQEAKVALITGSAKRVGACIAKRLHQAGLQIVIHYHNSCKAAEMLCDELNAQRSQSAVCYGANLEDMDEIPSFISNTVNTWGRLDVLVNNAAIFTSTSLTTLTVNNFYRFINSNLTAPFFLALAAAPYLHRAKGCLINMVDIHATQPLKHYTPYCISKAGLLMATKSLALEWAPDIRVNGIAPGVVLWPDESTLISEKLKKTIIAKTPLKRVGSPWDIAKAVHFLVEEAPYLTGQIIAIDGGRSLV